MSKDPIFPDTYIDPWTGEEKKVENWHIQGDVPINSKLRKSIQFKNTTLITPIINCGTNFEAQHRLIPDRFTQRRVLKMIVFYLAIGLLFLVLNFLIFHGALF